MTAGLRATLLVALCGCVPIARTAHGQVLHLGRRPAVAQLTLNSITVTASPATITFALQAGGLAPGSQPVSVTTSWLLGVASTVKLYGFFSSSAALTNSKSGTYTVPTSSVFGSCSSCATASFTAFTQAVPLGGAASGLLLFKQSALVSALVTRTDQVNLQIDLTALPQLPSGVYNGTLTLQAQAF